MRNAKPIVSLSKPRRLGGGPRLSDQHLEWWKTQALRIAELEGLRRCSVATLLVRIANADLDLSLNGIAQYRKKRTAA
jgi:hypothetical protein